MLDQFENYLHFLNVAPGKLPWEMAEHDDLLRGQPDEGGDGNGDDSGDVKPV
jgi:choline/glycine/proline betaine transport protein